MGFILVLVLVLSILLSTLVLALPLLLPYIDYLDGMIQCMIPLYMNIVLTLGSIWLIAY